MVRVVRGVDGADELCEHLLQADLAAAELPHQVRHHGAGQVRVVPQVDADRGLHRPVLPWAPAPSEALKHVVDPGVGAQDDDEPAVRNVDTKLNDCKKNISCALY